MLNTRVKYIRKNFNMSQETFGNKLGVTGAGISKIESGQRSVTDQMILMICKEFNINENWLRHGDGEIFRQKLPTGIEQLAEYYQLDELDKRIINEYSMLDERKRKVIKEYIMRIAYGNHNNAVILDGDVENEVLKCAEGPDTGEKYTG
ncbi:MAG: putative transcriptional regulator [Herbinix sp.]|jgi:transcriptional regulator with XRE-family HTH domain|nr:putative transcriptional regulator [Herbinix sp.]